MPETASTRLVQNDDFVEVITNAATGDEFHDSFIRTLCDNLTGALQQDAAADSPRQRVVALLDDCMLQYADILDHLSSQPNPRRHWIGGIPANDHVSAPELHRKTA